MKSEKLLTVYPLSGDKVILEPFSLARLNEFYSLYQNAKSGWEKFIVLHFKSIFEANNFIAQQFNNDGFVGFFIIDKKTNKLVGFILGDEVEVVALARTTAITPEFEGQGYVYEARKLFEQWVKTVGYETLLEFCDAENVRNIKLLERDDWTLHSKQKLGVGAFSMEMCCYIKQL